MRELLGISGSLRRDSYNTALLRSAATRLPPGFTMRIFPLNDIPPFDGDLEERGLPDAVVQLKAELMQTAGLVIATPEYNSSFPGVLKNALDWSSRPAAEIPRVFGGLPVAIMGATPGPLATVAAQAALLPVLRSLRAVLYSDRQLRVPNARTAFDSTGQLVDPEIASRLGAYLQGFCTFAEAIAGLRTASKNR